MSIKFKVLLYNVLLGYAVVGYDLLSFIGTYNYVDYYT